MNPVIKRLNKDIARLEKKKASERGPCNYCNDGVHNLYDQGGCVESSSPCQACDYEWHNAGITVEQDEIRDLIKLIEEAIRKEK